MSNVLFNAKNLIKLFKTQRGLLHAVDDISFTIDKGETLGLVGESGCGKSTTGRLILRLIEPTSGTVKYGGVDILSLKKREMRKYRQKMQIVFQDPYASLDSRRNVFESIEEPLRIHKTYSTQKETEKRVFELMETVGLAAHFINAYPHELDGGRRQRVGIARALALNPEFLVLDEPISALDVSIQAQILNLLEKLQKEFVLTYLFISHNLSVVKHISDRVAVMYLGKIVELANSREIFKNPLHPYTQALLFAVPFPRIDVEKKHIVLEGEVPSPINPPECCRFFHRCRFQGKYCKEGVPSLKEVSPGHFVACQNPEIITQ